MRDPNELLRRRSPGWVRAMDGRQIHQILGRFSTLRQAEGLSDRQEWLWDACISELEYRFRHPEAGERRCACSWCLPMEWILNSIAPLDGEEEPF